MMGFGNILAFVEHLAVVQTEIVVAEHEGLERGTRIVQAEAKAAIGEYQAAAGPFAAWSPLAEATKEDRARHGFSDDEPELRTGELRDSIQRVVVGNVGHVGSDNPVMVYQELGTPTIPPRSILGGAAVRKTNEVGKEIGETFVAALAGEKVGRLTIR